MSRFTTRVELHHAYEADYEKLHEEMRKEGFSRTIEADGGRWYLLPPAEYNLIADLTGEQVRAKASHAAEKTGKQHAVLVTEGGRVWQGLKEVTHASASAR